MCRTVRPDAATDRVAVPECRRSYVLPRHNYVTTRQCHPHAASLRSWGFATDFRPVPRQPSVRLATWLRTSRATRGPGNTFSGCGPTPTCRADKYLPNARRFNGQTVASRYDLTAWNSHPLRNVGLSSLLASLLLVNRIFSGSYCSLPS